MTKTKISGRVGAVAAAVAIAVGLMMAGGCGDDKPGGGGGGGSRDGGVLTDSRDGKSYRTVIIGDKRWMAENLNHAIANSWCYENDTSNCSKYGRLYDWGTAMDVCPGRWHLPSRQEWDELVMFAGGSSVAIKTLKSKKGWNNRDDGTSSNGTDNFRFSALPGGIRFPDGRFHRVGNGGEWWSATGDANDSAFSLNMYYLFDRVYDGYNHKDLGFSVRCLQE